MLRGVETLRSTMGCSVPVVPINFHGKLAGRSLGIIHLNEDRGAEPIEYEDWCFLVAVPLSVEWRSAEG